MDTLITGATGFIGVKLARQLLSRGDAVNYTARKRAQNFDTRAAFHPWDGKAAPPVASMPRLDAVFNLMGEPIAQRWSPEVKDRIRASRIASTRQLVSAIGALKHKPSVLVSASAVGYYGNRADEILEENSAPGNGFLADVCRDWEAEALRAREFGLRVVLIRIATVLGPDGGALPKMALPFKLGLGGKFGEGRQWMSWIHVEDLVSLLLFAADSTDAHGPLNGAAPNPVTNADFTRELAEAVHRPAVFTVPKFALKLAMGEMAEFVFDSLRVVPEATERAGFRFEYPTLGPALESALK